MAQFYIEKVMVTGPGKEPSEVVFCDGLNFLIGPSNTGKTNVANCIDYLFGFEATKIKPFDFDPSFGYDTFTLILKTPNGQITLTRKYGVNKINVVSTDPNFEDGSYSTNHTTKKNISAFWLQLMGIDEPHKILQSQAGKLQHFTLRTILHMFFVKQNDVTRKTSVLCNPEVALNMTITPSKAGVLFMMTGKDADESENPEDKKIRSAKKAAVIEYIRATVGRYASRESELLNARTSLQETASTVGYQIDDVRLEIDAINREINGIQSKINEQITQSRFLMKEIYKCNGRLAECETIADQFTVLRSQYQSDIERLTFVINGNVAHAQLPKRERCPFCDGEINSEEESTSSESIRAELQHLKVHIAELDKAERDIAKEKSGIEAKAAELEERKRSIDLFVSSELTPQLTILKDKLRFFRSITEINKELEVVQAEERSFNTELFEKETEEAPTEVKIDMNSLYDRLTIKAFEEKLISILQTCHYDGASSARLNMDTFDLEVGGKTKAISNGGGYCGFLNTVLALAFVEFLEEQGEYSPGILIVDSPLTQLSESEYKDEASALITGFLKYLISIYEKGTESSQTPSEQIILIEHKEKLPMLIETIGDAKHIKVIEFTKSREHGRFGFLKDVFTDD